MEQLTATQSQRKYCIVDNKSAVKYFNDVLKLHLMLNPYVSRSKVIQFTQCQQYGLFGTISSVTSGGIKLFEFNLNQFILFLAIILFRDIQKNQINKNEIVKSF